VFAEPHLCRGPGSPGAPPPGIGGDIFKQPAPKGHAKTVSAVLGEIVWLMSQSALHKQFFISDLEWFVMTPILCQQFRLFYAKNKPVGVVLWAFANDEVAKRLAEGTTKLRPQDWKSGDQLWVVEAIAPFGGPEAMIQNLKDQVFADKELRYLTMNAEGKKELKVL
jgi:cytolysin-activating lysine-acyltransferase